MDGPRACRDSEFDEVISLINRVFRAGTDQDIGTDYPLVFDRSKMDYMRVVSVDGKIVSHVPVAPREVVAAGDRFMVGIISPTVTHPDYRRRGYATLCLRDCVRIMEEEDWPVSVLWTVEATFPFYHNSGWEAVGPQGWVYRLKPEDADLFEAGELEVTRYDPEDIGHLDAIIGIHDAEPFRIARSRPEYQALLSLPKTKTLLAMKGKEAVAYLMLGEGTNKPGLIEGGGEADGLEALVHHVLREREGRETQALAPLTPTSLGKLLESHLPGGGRPIEGADGVGPQMMRVNSLEGLLRRIGNHLSRRTKGVRGEVCLVCHESGEAVTLGFDDGLVSVSAGRTLDAVVLSRRQLTELIFGPYAAAKPLNIDAKARDLLERVFPFYFPVWELDHS